MLVDLEPAPRERTFHSDVCILGAGIAGLTLATRLAARGMRVHLLEAGGLQLEPRSQSLYTVDQAASTHTGATEGRFRVFGGSSTRWGGQLLPYPHDVFRPGDEIPSLPWPIGPEELEPHYAEVLRIMGLPDRPAALPFDGPGLLSALGHPGVDLGPEVRLRYSKWAPFARRNLAGSLGRECLASSGVQVFLHANAIALETSGGEVCAAVVRNYAGEEFRFTAAQFCVCLGTIESSRLLLASQIGTANDQTGRYFHDHVGVRAAAVVGEAREQILKRLGPFFVEGVLHTCKLEANAALRESRHLPAVMAHIVIEEPEDSGIGAVRAMLRALQRRELGAALGGTGAVARGIGDVARLVYASRVQGRRAVSRGAQVWLHIDLEQKASAEQRIRLSTEGVDALGEPRAVVEWHVGEPERAVVRQYAPVVREALANAGFPALRWLPGVLNGDPNQLRLADTYHPMGGLRMGTDPAQSVVDPQLAVHGLPNLHVASCAVFPSGGSSNPTFTLMALALRLAAHLAGARAPAKG